MKQFTTCFTIYCKRLLKKPLFLFTLVLLPVSVLFLQNCQTSTDAVVRVALYTPDKTSDTVTNKLFREMVSLSNTAITFYEVSTEKSLRQDIADGKASCGYIFPENLEDKLKDYARKKEPYITAIRTEDDVRTRIVDEIVLSRIYRPISYQILASFLEKKTEKVPDTEQLSRTFQKYSSDELLFQFEYANGDKNTFLNDSQANYMLMPIRGVTSVMILLSCMAGGILWYSDAGNALFLMNNDKRRLCGFLSLLLPGVFASLTGLFTMQITGISENPVAELVSMLFFLCACLSLVHFLRTVLPRKELFLAAMPVITIASLLLCPIFISLQTIAPALSSFSCIFPTTWYLSSLHEPKALFYLFLYSFCLVAVTMLLTKWIVGKRFLHNVLTALFFGNIMYQKK